MAARMEKTRHAGIYKRGGRYAFSYRMNGKQRWESARTLDEARKLKAAQTADLARGEFSELSALMLHAGGSGSTATRARGGGGSARRRAASIERSSRSTR